MLVVFAYLGTGYQFAKFNWELYHSAEGKAWREDTKDPTGNYAYRTLWPVSSVTPSAPDNKPPISRVPPENKQEYIWMLTFFWGFKLVWNAFFIFIFIPIFHLLTIIAIPIYAFGKFVIALALSPFA